LKKNDQIMNSETISVWLADLTYTQQTIATDTIPFAIGSIATYLEKKVPAVKPVKLFKYPEMLIKSINSKHLPDIIGFSNYIWNCNLSYEFAKAIHSISPSTIIVFGGPNYPTETNEQISFLQERPVIDFYIVKEGEAAFTDLVQNLIGNKMNCELIHGKLNSVHSIDSNNNYYLPPEADRIKDLSDIPSPYVAGKLDPFFDGKLMPVLQFIRGCPFSCTYCAEGVPYYNEITKKSAKYITDELECVTKKMQERSKKEGRNDLFIADSNFGLFKEDITTAREIGRLQKSYGWPDYINVATAKNKKDQVLRIAELVNGAIRISGSVQSLDPVVLENIKRTNISTEELINLALEAQNIGANSYCEIILALPGDSKETHLTTIRNVINAGFNNIFLFQLMILHGSALATIESMQKYGMQFKYRVIPRCYGNYELNGTNIISAEIEKICVASNTLSFEDYLFCRKLHLIITIFYNDGVFSSVLKFLKINEISIFDWMEKLLNTPLTGNMKSLFDDFLQDTRDELWGSKEELLDFILINNNVEKFINGELGRNLLFIYKTLAITQYPTELSHLALTTLKDLLKENNVNTDDRILFIEECVEYQKNKIMYIFENIDITSKGIFNYDIDSFERSLIIDSFQNYRFNGPKEIEFYLNEEQKNMITKYIHLYGKTPVGVGRIFSKLYVKKIFRNARHL